MYWQEDGHLQLRIWFQNSLIHRYTMEELNEAWEITEGEGPSWEGTEGDGPAGEGT